LRGERRRGAGLERVGGGHELGRAAERPICVLRRGQGVIGKEVEAAAVREAPGGARIGGSHGYKVVSWIFFARIRAYACAKGHCVALLPNCGHDSRAAKIIARKSCFM